MNEWMRVNDAEPERKNGFDKSMWSINKKNVEQEKIFRY